MIQALPCHCTHYPHPCPILSTGQRLVLMSPCRVIASQASVPLVYVPLEAVASQVVWRERAAAVRGLQGSRDAARLHHLSG